MDFEEELQLVLKSYEFPAYQEVPQSTFIKWSIKRCEGMELIRPVLNPKNARKRRELDFFGLPAELRNMIYDMIFQYPTEPGLRIPKWQPKPSMRFNTDFKQELTKDEQVIGTTFVENTRLIGRILDPLLTCRQFYKEAMPAFYKINNFCFEDLDHLTRQPRKLTSKRRQHISHISFAYPRRDRVVAETAFKFLATFERLRIINLRIEETSWLKYARTRAEREAVKEGRDTQQAREQYRSALDMPGMSILRSLRGLEEVNVSGIRKDTVKQITIDTLRADLTQPKKKKIQVAVKSKKRHSDWFEVILEAELMEDGKRKKAKVA